MSTPIDQPLSEATTESIIRELQRRENSSDGGPSFMIVVRWPSRDMDFTCNDDLIVGSLMMYAADALNGDCEDDDEKCYESE